MIASCLGWGRDARVVRDRERDRGARQHLPKRRKAAREIGDLVGETRGDGIRPAEGRGLGGHGGVLAQPPGAAGGHGFGEQKPQHIDLALDVVRTPSGRGS
jgi:hypothetical protein